MKKIKLHYYFWLVSGCFIISTLFTQTDSNSTIDINLHDTYYVIHHSVILLFFATFYGLIGFIYFIFFLRRIRLFTIVTKIHSTVTLGLLPTYFIGLLVLEMKNDSEFPLFDDNLGFQWFVFILSLFFVFAQILFILNIIFNLIKQLFFKN